MSSETSMLKPEGKEKMENAKAVLKVGEEATLNELLVGSVGVITHIQGEGKLRRRLFDMGLTPGAEVFLRKKAPLGDPLEVTLRGYELTLRKNEAANVVLKVTDLSLVSRADPEKREK